MKHYIYLITNKITNEKYVGETKLGIKKRFTAHCWNAKKGDREKYRLYQDIRKLGKDNFKVELLEELEITDRSEALDREAYWIDKLDTYNNGYNNAPRQFVTSLGYKFSEERKKEYSEKFKGEGNPMYGKNVKDYMTEEQIASWRKNMSEARKGMKFTEEHKKAISENSTRKRKIIKENLINGEITEYPSLTVASKENGVAIGTISNRIKRSCVINNEVFKYGD